MIKVHLCAEVKSGWLLVGIDYKSCPLCACDIDNSSEVTNVVESARRRLERALADLSDGSIEIDVRKAGVP